MTLIYKIIAYIITIPLFTIWLLFCFIISLIGSVLYKKRIYIDLDRVKKRETICSVLNNKKYLSDEEYEFETVEVACIYDELTFRGYLFVLAPVIFLLKHFSFTDDFVFYLVKKWMDLHKFQREHKKRPKSFFSSLMSLCVLLAFFVGQVLYRIKP
nr:hypothetical protein [Malaciobacter halophilus]